MDFSFSLTDFESFLKTISSIAVIAGTFFVVLQLRLNAKMVRSRNAFDLIGKVIDPSFQFAGTCCTRWRGSIPVAIGPASIAVLTISR
jgi:hypothetical protein